MNRPKTDCSWRVRIILAHGEKLLFCYLTDDHFSHLRIVRKAPHCSERGGLCFLVLNTHRRKQVRTVFCSWWCSYKQALCSIRAPSLQLRPEKGQHPLRSPRAPASLPLPPAWRSRCSPGLQPPGPQKWVGHHLSGLRDSPQTLIPALGRS